MAGNAYQVGNLELRIVSYAQNASSSINKMNSQLNNTKKVLKNVGITAMISKWKYMLNIARYYGRSLANIVQYAMDYVETQNLWQVANRNNLQMADEFISKLNKAYGISEQTLMNYQAIFKNMLSALGGISDMVSSTLSLQLTQMALDFSSLYNVTIPSAMQKFQAVLSGQVRPIRSISGYDITENTIFDLYQQMGGEKSMRQLSQIEKRLLRIYAVFGQMGETGALGDFGKTIETAANQSRIMSEQWKEMLTWAGQSILMWLNQLKVLQQVNAVLITMKEIFKSLAYAGGYSEQDFLAGLLEQADGATEAVDELQGKLLSFDKFEALNSTDSNALGIDPTIENMLKNINYLMGDNQIQAQGIAEQWLNTLGFVEAIDEETGKGLGYYKMTKKAQELLKVVKTIASAIGGILAFSLATKIVLLVTKITGLKTSIIGLKTVMDLLKSHPIMMLITVITTALIYLYTTNEEVRKSINAMFYSLAPLISSVSELVPILVDSLQPIIHALAEGVKLLAGFVKFLADGFTSLGSMIASASPQLRTIIGIIGTLASALFVGAAAWMAFHGAMSWGVAAITIAASLAAGYLMMKNTFGAIAEFADGGFPEEGQLFIANEAGPEMVGSMGGKTTVANNEQIVNGIKEGVYSAVLAANSQNKSKLSGDVYLYGEKVGKIIEGGVYNEGVRVGHFSRA